MKSNYLASLALTFAMLLPIAGNAAGFQVLEDGREVAASMLTLPSLADGQLSIQGCGNCKRLTFAIAPTARFYVGATEVSFADLKRHLAKQSERQRHGGQPDPSEHRHPHQGVRRPRAVVRGTQHEIHPKVSVGPHWLRRHVASAPNAIADDSEVFTNTAFVANDVRTERAVHHRHVRLHGHGRQYVRRDTGLQSGTSAICPSNDRVYWTTTNSATPPDCRTATDQWVSVDNNRCRTAANGMAGSGWWNGRTQMLITGGNPTFWGNLVARTDAKLECSGDSGNHGDLPGTSAPGGEDKYARNGAGNLDTQPLGQRRLGQPGRLEHQAALFAVQH